MRNTFSVPALCLSLLLLAACSPEQDLVIPPADQSEEISLNLPSQDAGIATHDKIQFSGFTWFVRKSGYSGPGLNMFSNRMSNVWVDSQGNLHLKLTYFKGNWYCAEVYSENFFGYGTYTFKLASRVDTLDKNVVVGLFTWNNNSFQSDANSEVDIEFARWGNGASSTLQYSVQPSGWQNFQERFHYPSNYTQTGNFTTHTFTWKQNEVKFDSYHGHGNPTPWPAGNWSFDNTMGSRRKTEGGRTSDLVNVPRPGTSTRVHMNIWLYDANRDGFGDPPSDGQEVEVVIHSFEFTPI